MRNISFIVVGLLCVAGCSKTPTAPTSVVSSSPNTPWVFTGDLTGTWVGSYNVTSCSPTSLNDCRWYMPGGTFGGALRPGAMTLTLKQTGQELSGTFQSEFMGSAPFPITGTVNASGFMNITGTRRDLWWCFAGLGPGTNVVWGELADWVTQITKDGELLGTFNQKTLHSVSSCYTTLYNYNSEVVALRRQQ